MAEAKKAAEQQPVAAELAEGGAGLLQQFIDVTPQTARDRVTDWLQELAREVMKGTVTWDRSLTLTVTRAMDLIDAQLSRQLAAILHHPDFQKLEGTWRGLQHLVFKSETSAQLKIRTLNVSKRDLAKDLERAIEFDQSQMFQKLYEQEFGMPGGEPYGALIGDYEFSHSSEDVDMLQRISGVAAAAFCPFISAASPQLFGFQDFTELPKKRDLEQIFQSQDYIRWRSFRDSDDARFVTLVMPRVLSRLPYGSKTKQIDEFNFEEVEPGPAGQARAMDHAHYAWMNAAYAFGARLTDSFAQNAWCTAIRGKENGGMVEGLPTHVFVSDDGDLDSKCPTEVGITDRRENELSKLGFLALCHWKNTDYSVFIGGQTVQKPKQYDRADATANAQISARLPYIMAVSRMAHYLKVIARDKIGSAMERADVEDFLKRWIANYVCNDPHPTAEMKRRLPLAEAKIEVVADERRPGSYNAVAWLRPWLYMEELTTSLRMVASIPKLKG